MTVSLQDVALAQAGNLGLLAEAQLNGVERERIGNHLYGGFGRDFRTKDGPYVMVVALTTRHWRELLAVTGLGPAVEAMAHILHADFSTEDDRFRYRELIAGLVSPWFEDRRLTDVEPALGATTLLWSTYRTFSELVGKLRAELEANRSFFLDRVPRSELGVDGHPREGGFLPPIPHRRRMFAGGRLQVIHPISVGEQVTRRPHWWTPW